MKLDWLASWPACLPASSSVEAERISKEVSQRALFFSASVSLLRQSHCECDLEGMRSFSFSLSLWFAVHGVCTPVTEEGGERGKWPWRRLFFSETLTFRAIRRCANPQDLVKNKRQCDISTARTEAEIEAGGKRSQSTKLKRPSLAVRSWE